MTTEFKITLEDGRDLWLPVNSGPKQGVHHRCFVFALHKSGSVLLNEMMRKLSPAAGYPFVDFPGFVFGKSVKIPDVTGGMEALFSCNGMVFGGFRNFPPDSVPLNIVAQDKVILLVRDPRDILVSFYFSELKSHALPPEGPAREALLKQREAVASKGIEKYVEEKALFVERQFQKYERRLLNVCGENCRIYRYEDVIFSKRQWMGDVASFFEWDIPLKKIQRVADKHDVIPGKEEPGNHIRRVTPGDHREKLKPATVDSLTERFRDVAAPFGYEL